MSIRYKLAKGLVIAASAGALIAGAATASFAGTTPTPTPTVTVTPSPSPLPVTCRSRDKITLTFNGHQFRYPVVLRLTPLRPFFSGNVLVTGTLCDTYEAVPLVLNVHGLIFGGDATVFSVRYPTVGVDAGPQGVRTFSGLVGPFGHVIGSWSETGSENGAGPFSLGRI